jgi:hypothetical protein
MSPPEVRQSVAAALVKAAWHFSVGGFHEEARLAYKTADDILPVGHHGADFSVLRHTKGTLTKGAIVDPVPATEDIVYAFYLYHDPVTPNAGTVMKAATTDGDILESGIRKFLDTFNPGFHRENIPRDIPHVMVMSTGRCGTMSLYKMFQKSSLVPYHSYWWQNTSPARLEAICCLIERCITDVFDEWLSTRAAEWLGAISNNRPVIGLNHLDTIFAPVFSVIHPESKFVYLHRDPMAVFESFYGKEQWLNNQLCPINYTFDPVFQFHTPEYGLPHSIAWYIKFTEMFSRAMGRVMGGRFIEIQAEDLFSQKSGKIADLLNFVGADIPLDVAIEHFATKINEKTHKAVEVDDAAREEFMDALCRF